MTNASSPNKRNKINKNVVINTEPIDPSKDGIDHINVDKRATTRLGVLLANFSNSPFTHPIYGPFKSIEGFWHWIKSENRDDYIRGLFGYEAKQCGRKYYKTRIIENFKEEIITAIYYKVIQNDELFNLLLESNLPFKQYYLYGPKKIPISTDSAHWQCEGIDIIRKHIQEYGKAKPFKYK